MLSLLLTGAVDPAVPNVCYLRLPYIIYTLAPRNNPHESNDEKVMESYQPRGPSNNLQDSRSWLTGVRTPQAGVRPTVHVTFDL